MERTYTITVNCPHCHAITAVGATKSSTSTILHLHDRSAYMDTCTNCGETYLISYTVEHFLLVPHKKKEKTE